MGNVFTVSFSCDGILSRFWDSISGRATYVGLEGNLQALSISLEDLTSLKNDVLRRVDLAEQQQLQRLDQVQSWISRVETIETEVDEVVNDGTQQIEDLCCGGCCSKNYFSRYKYGKKVAEKLVELTALKSKGELFEEVASESLPAAVINEISIEPTVGMEPMVDRVWSHIEDVEVGVIGLYGMGGVGKTTLLTKIRNNFHHSPNDFNLVILVVVSKDLKLELIQDKIGEKIGFSGDKWKHREQHEKAEDIFRVLSKKKFVLLLDDIWEQVETTKIGVPVPDKCNMSKIVFTTRSEDVCGRMEAHKKFKVPCLAWDKAWNLFEEKVGKETLFIHPDIPKLAQVVAKECGGLPLALITVGRAMACKKTPEEWNRSIHVLKQSASDFSGMGDKVYPLLKFSYDSLPNEKVRSCFLYCALFPEDFLISKEDLWYCWMGEELLDEHASVDEARNESYHTIGTLLNACMLEVGTNHCVKMHDVIRDMALWLACDPEKTKENFLVHTGANLIEAPSVKKWKSSKRVSLMANCITDLVEAPRSPNVLTLFLCTNNLKTIAKGFFDFMHTLQVLDLSENENLTQLPSGVSKLVSLQHLNLSRTGVRDLPVEFKALVKLIYLNLERMNNLVFIPPNLISSFLMLKVLRMYECGGSSGGVLLYGPYAIIDELEGLKHLEVFTLSLKGLSTFQELCSYNTLRTCTRLLGLKGHNSYTDLCDVSNLADMKHLEHLFIADYSKLEQMDIYWIGREGFDPRNSMRTSQSCFLGLQHVEVVSCDELKDLTWLIFAPNLNCLYIHFCKKIKKIINLKRLGGVATVVGLRPFEKLATLHLSNLPLLKSIYESALPFPYLKEMHINWCDELKKLPLNCNTVRISTLRIIGMEGWWNQLEWEDQLSRHAFLPCFRRG